MSTSPSKSPHENHRQRIYDRYLKSGIEAFAPHEVLELLLIFCIPRKDVNPLAHALIQRFGSLSGVMDAHPDDLRTTPGMTPRAAVFMRMLPDIMRIYVQQKAVTGQSLDTEAKVLTYCQSLFWGRTREQFYVLCLDHQYRLIQTLQVGQGSISGIQVQPREVVEIILRYNSAQVILAHNHPSGSTEPSSEDYIFTRQVIQSLDAIEIPVLDHIIIGDDSAYSFSREGRIHKIINEIRSI